MPLFADGWWTHPKSREIFAVAGAIRDSPGVLVCRLIGGKVTFVHRRLWPALVRLKAAAKKLSEDEAEQMLARLL